MEILGKTYDIDKTTSLNLSGKNLTVFPNSICKLINLQFLKLDKNQITSIPPDIENLINLRYLHLHDNQINNLPPEIGNLVNLRKILLRRNKIKNILDDILKIKEKVIIDETGYDIDNLDLECEFLILYELGVPLTNLPINLKEIWIYSPLIDIDQLKIPFGCKVYVDNVLIN